jgi:hypothetical protein
MAGQIGNGRAAPAQVRPAHGKLLIRQTITAALRMK